MEMIKNIQIILGILFEYREIILFFSTIIFTVINVILSIFINSKYTSQINNNTNKKKEVKNIIKWKKVCK